MSVYKAEETHHKHLLGNQKNIKRAYKEHRKNLISQVTKPWKKNNFHLCRAQHGPKGHFGKKKNVLSIKSDQINDFPR